jgi:hypothetical protein
MSSFNLRGGAQRKPGRFVELGARCPDRGEAFAAYTIRCAVALLRYDEAVRKWEEPPGAFSLIVEASLLVVFVAVIDAGLR